MCLVQPLDRGKTTTPKSPMQPKPALGSDVLANHREEITQESSKFHGARLDRRGHKCVIARFKTMRNEERGIRNLEVKDVHFKARTESIAIPNSIFLVPHSSLFLSSK